MRFIVFTIFLIFFSCSENAERATDTAFPPDNTLKPYQRYCLNVLKRVTAHHVGYQVSDSFYLWSDGYVSNGWKPYYITRTVYHGAYAYLFWKEENDNFHLYKNIAVPKKVFVQDTLFDVNGDNYKDLVITENSMSAQCQRKFSNLFCFNIDQGEFLKSKR